MWKIINEFPDYMINEYGVIYKVHGKKKNRIMQPKIDKDGYYHIGLRNEHGRFFKRVHRLVAETFIPNYNDEFDIVNHIVLRSMSKAKYSEKNAGHFGLSVERGGNPQVEDAGAHGRRLRH